MLKLSRKFGKRVSLVGLNLYWLQAKVSSPMMTDIQQYKQKQKLFQKILGARGKEEIKAPFPTNSREQGERNTLNAAKCEGSVN